MESAILQLASQQKDRATENIITLLASYYWRGRIHFLFPFIDGDLRVLLNGGFKPSSLPLDLATNDLADHWLWKQMIGVTQALSQIHSGLTGSTPTKGGRIIAFHLDLKPANILVAINGVLKITDFGQSVIDTLENIGATLNVSYAGDPEYGDPESAQNAAESNENEGQISIQEQVRLVQNCDVWSLACIMTEVLVFLMGARHNKPGCQALNDFNILRHNAGSLMFYDNKAQVKACVREIIVKFSKDYAGNFWYNQYLRGLKDILLGSHILDPTTGQQPVPGMFTSMRSLRMSSAEVVKELTNLENAYRLADEESRDPLVRYLEMKELSDGDGFREVGWTRGPTVVSFLDV